MKQIEDKKARFICWNTIVNFIGDFSKLWHNYDLNNGKGSSINLWNEIKSSDLILGKKSDSETSDLERRFTQSIPAKVNTDDCVIM